MKFHISNDYRYVWMIKHNSYQTLFQCVLINLQLISEDLTKSCKALYFKEQNLINN